MVFGRSIKSLLFLALLLTCAGSAYAGWREELGTFRIGVSASDMRALSPKDVAALETAYAQALGMPAKITVLRDYPALIDAQVSGRIEYALYSSTAYASAWLLCECVEPLVAPVLDNGATGISSALIVNAATPFTRLDLNGIKVGIPGKDSITGFAIPLASYTVGTRALSQDESFLRPYPDLETTAAAFSEGKIDAFFGWAAANGNGPVPGAGLMGSGDNKLLLVQGRPIEIKMPWTSKLLRFGPHAVRRDLDAEAKALLVSFLSSANVELLDLLSVTQAGGVGKLVPVRQSEYELAIQAAKAAAAIAK